MNTVMTWLRCYSSVVLIMLCLLFSGCDGDGKNKAEGEDVAHIAKRLREIDKGGPVSAELRVTYTDLHGFHGGLRLAVRGDGKVEQEAVRQQAGTPRDLTEAQVREVIALLVREELWRQKVKERQAVPDESRARVIIELDGKRVETWEWFNDLDKNDRIVRLREKLKALAWK